MYTDQISADASRHILRRKHRKMQKTTVIYSIGLYHISHLKTVFYIVFNDVMDIVLSKCHDVIRHIYESGCHLLTSELSGC